MVLTVVRCKALGWYSMKEEVKEPSYTLGKQENWRKRDDAGRQKP